MADIGLETPHHIHAFRTSPPLLDGFGFARHIHPFHEIMGVVGGEGVQLFGPQRLPFVVGDVFFLPAGSWHIAGGGESTCCVVLNFYDAAFADAQPGEREARRIVEALTRHAYAGRPRLEVGAATRRRVLAGLAALAEAGEHRQEFGWQCAIKGELLAILGWLARDADLQVAAELRQHADFGGERLRRVTDHIREHLAEPLTVGRLAAVAGLSPSHFHAVFKRRTGLSAIAYLTQVRVETAAELLRGESLPIKEVARRCGFSCLSHFYAVFRRHTGSPPARYARR